MILFLGIIATKSGTPPPPMKVLETIGIFKRYQSTCALKFPLNEEYFSKAKIKHLHFKGLTPYSKASEIQAKIVQRHTEYKIRHKNPRVIAPIYPTIMTFEFESVYTGGKRERNAKLATPVPSNLGIPYVQTDRGGQVTYHGPGQLVAYFLWDTKLWKGLTARCFVNFVEQCSVATVKKTGVDGVCTTENTGVWVKRLGDEQERKIGSIGMNMRRGVSSHGLSINLRPNLMYLNNLHFVMCGLDGYKQTSVVNEIGDVDIDVSDLGDLLIQSVTERMDVYMGAVPVEKHIFPSIDDFDLDYVTYNQNN